MEVSRVGRSRFSQDTESSYVTAGAITTETLSLLTIDRGMGTHVPLGKSKRALGFNKVQNVCAQKRTTWFRSSL